MLQSTTGKILGHRIIKPRHVVPIRRSPLHGATGLDISGLITHQYEAPQLRRVALFLASIHRITIDAIASPTELLTQFLESIFLALRRSTYFTTSNQRAYHAATFEKGSTYGTIISLHISLRISTQLVPSEI
jgi:hypothetical protein